MFIRSCFNISLLNTLKSFPSNLTKPYLSGIIDLTEFCGKCSVSVEYLLHKNYVENTQFEKQE